MLKLVIVFICFSFSVLPVANAEVKFDDIIKNNLVEENTIASEMQQFAGIESEAKKKSSTDYVAAKAKKETDFKVVLRRKFEKKNPAIQRSIASKKNRVAKKIKKKKNK